MQEYVYFLFGSFVLYLNYFILGSILHQKLSNKVNYITFYETTLISVILLSIFGFLLHFFFSLNEKLNLILFTSNFFLIFFLKKKQTFNILRRSFFYLLILILVISFSRNPEDANLYHNSYIALINNDKISFGISNLHFRFGHTALIQYLSGLSYIPKISPYLIITQNNFFYCLVLSIFFNFFKSGLVKKNYFFASFNILAVLFFTLKFSKHSDWGIDVIPALLTVYLCSMLIKLKEITISDDTFKILLTQVGLIILFVFLNRTTYAFLIFFPILLLIINNINIKKIFQFKIIIFFSFIIILYFIKNFINTSCLIYPFYFSCFETNWSSEIVNHLDYQKIYYQSKAWSMGYPSSNGEITEEIYVKNFNWIDSWLSVHFLKIIEKTFPFLILISVIYIILNFYLIKKNTINKKKYINKSYKFIFIFYLFSIIFWFLNFPLYRYGAGFIMTFLILLASILFMKIFQNKEYKTISIIKIFFIISLLILSLKNFHRLTKDYSQPLLPLTFKSHQINSINIKNNKIYYYKNLELCYYPYSSPCVKDNTDFIKDIQVIKGYKFYLTK